MDNRDCIDENGKIIKGFYRHFKNKHYEVIGEAYHSETLETVVVYKALYSKEDRPINTLWVRPKDMFLEEVPENRKNPTGQKYRFEMLKEN